MSAIGPHAKLDMRLDGLLIGVERRPGRYAYCSGGRSASKIGSSTSIVAVMHLGVVGVFYYPRDPASTEDPKRQAVRLNGVLDPTEALAAKFAVLQSALFPITVW
jgi:hypothetical protein